MHQRILAGAATVVRGPEPGACPEGRVRVPGPTRTTGSAGAPVLRVAHGGQRHELPVEPARSSR